MPMLGAVEYTTPDPGRRIALFIGCGANMTALELPRISPSLRLGKRALNVHQRLLCVKQYFTLSASVIAQPQVMKPSKTMTVREAAAVWNNPRADFLERWGGMFDLRLEQITPGHMMKYQMDRSRETALSIVDVELRALTELLKLVGLPEVGAAKDLAYLNVAPSPKGFSFRKG
jgi:hypothetical protein